MFVVAWFLMGAGVGVVAIALRPTRRSSGLVYPVLGVMGAVIGGVAAAGPGAALAGAVVLAVVYAAFSDRAPRPARGRYLHGL